MSATLFGVSLIQSQPPPPPPPASGPSIVVSAIGDTFDNEDQLVGYDSLLSQDPNDRNAVLSNDHIDVRIFQNTPVYRLRMQSEMDNITQSVWDNVTQADIELVPVSDGEDWQSTFASGGTTITVGPNSTLQWKALESTMNGSALSVVLTSSGTTAYDISAMDFISIVVQLTGSGTIADVNLGLTSDPAGEFGNGFDAAFDLSQGTSLEWRTAIGNFTNGNVDITNVTGVQLTITSGTSPANNDKLRVLALRAYIEGYNPAYQGDINTQLGAIGIPVSFNLT